MSRSSHAELYKSGVKCLIQCHGVFEVFEYSVFKSKWTQECILISVTALVDQLSNDMTHSLSHRL